MQSPLLSWSELPMADLDHTSDNDAPFPSSGAPMFPTEDSDGSWKYPLLDTSGPLTRSSSSSVKSTDSPTTPPSPPINRPAHLAQSDADGDIVMDSDDDLISPSYGRARKSRQSPSPPPRPQNGWPQALTFDLNNIDSDPTHTRPMSPPARVYEGGHNPRISDLLPHQRHYTYYAPRARRRSAPAPVASAVESSLDPESTGVNATAAAEAPNSQPSRPLPSNDGHASSDSVATAADESTEQSLADIIEKSLTGPSVSPATEAPLVAQAVEIHRAPSSEIVQHIAEVQQAPPAPPPPPPSAAPSADAPRIVATDRDGNPFYPPYNQWYQEGEQYGLVHEADIRPGIGHHLAGEPIIEQPHQKVRGGKALPAHPRVPSPAGSSLSSPSTISTHASPLTDREDLPYPSAPITVVAVASAAPQPRPLRSTTAEAFNDYIAKHGIQAAPHSAEDIAARKKLHDEQVAGLNAARQEIKDRELAVSLAADLAAEEAASSSRTRRSRNAAASTSKADKASFSRFLPPSASAPKRKLAALPTPTPARGKAFLTGKMHKSNGAISRHADAAMALRTKVRFSQKRTIVHDQGISEAVEGREDEDVAMSGDEELQIIDESDYLRRSERRVPSGGKGKGKAVDRSGSLDESDPELELLDDDAEGELEELEESEVSDDDEYQEEEDPRSSRKHKHASSSARSKPPQLNKPSSSRSVPSNPRKRTHPAADVDEDDGEARPHPCKEPGCSKSFKRAHDRDRHYQTHNDKKDEKCLGCAKCFKRKDALNRHLRTCDKAYKHHELAKARAKKRQEAQSVVDEEFDVRAAEDDSGEDDDRAPGPSRGRPRPRLS